MPKMSCMAAMTNLDVAPQHGSGVCERNRMDPVKARVALPAADPPDNEINADLSRGPPRAVLILNFQELYDLLVRLSRAMVRQCAR